MGWSVESRNSGWKSLNNICLAFLILLPYLLPAFSQQCVPINKPNCTTPQYTVKLNVKSDVDAYDGVHHVIAYENVSLTATAHPNAKLTNQSFIFQYRYLGGDWNECLRVKSSRPATVVYKWKDGVVECVVLLVTQGDRILGCANASIQIAAKGKGLSVDVKTYQPNHNEPYAIGNVTFLVKVNLTDKHFLEYFLCYSFGDNTTATQKNPASYGISSLKYTHNYTTVCRNCSYVVTLIALTLFNSSYNKINDSISVIKPVTNGNSDINVADSKQLYKGRPIKLKMTSDATPPYTVCWNYHPASKVVNNSKCPLSTANGTTCLKIQSSDLFKPSITFPNTGLYVLMASIKNDISCITLNHTLKVVTIPVTVEVVAGGVVGIIVSCVIVAVLITVIVVYVQYRRYKNKHTETARFNFVFLPPINTDSKWARFKMACRRRWYRFTGRRFKEGLVPRLDGSGNYTIGDSYSSAVSYGTLLQSERTESCKDIQVSVLHDLASSGYHKNDHDKR